MHGEEGRSANTFYLVGDMSSRLREDSAKYKRAAVRINWELLLKQYGPFAGLGLVILILLVWRFW